jgi:subtilisin family serine protease
MNYKIYALAVAVIVSMTFLISCDTSLVDQSEPTSSEMEITTAQQGLLSTEDNSVDGEYVILFKNDKLPKGFGDEVEALGGKVIFQHKSGFAYISGISQEASEQIQSSGYINQMTANVSYSLGDPGKSYTIDEAVISSPDNPSSAFVFARQWNMRAIGADKAWAAGILGDEDVTIAIIDTGIDYLNPDLVGLVDLNRSASFVPIDDSFAESLFPNRNPVTDLHYHGTHVAATAASNAIAAAGVTSKTTLTAIKACTFTNFSCSFGAVFSSLLYAADTDVDIANLSLGGSFPKAGNGEFVGFINSTLNYLRREGVTVVVAAGNASTDIDKNGNIYQSYCDAPNVICVSATGPTAAESINGPFTDVDAPAPYTNFGRSAIDVAAPGGAFAPVTAVCSQTSLIVPVCQSSLFVIGLNGTSMAAPHVSGLAALLVSQGINKPSQIKARILQSADDLGQNGTDKFYGKGRINVANALGL